MVPEVAAARLVLDRREQAGAACAAWREVMGWMLGHDPEDVFGVVTLSAMEAFWELGKGIGSVAFFAGLGRGQPVPRVKVMIEVSDHF